VKIICREPDSHQRSLSQLASSAQRNSCMPRFMMHGAAHDTAEKSPKSIIYLGHSADSGCTCRSGCLLLKGEKKEEEREQMRNIAR
jgi:hypothetical protein